MTITAERITHAPSVRDETAATRAAADFLTALGLDVTSAGLAETPARMARAYAELLTPREFALTTFENDEGYDELVLARDVPSASHMSATCPATASSDCPSWPAWWSCSPTGRRSRSG